MIRAVGYVQQFNVHSAPLRLDVPKTVRTGQRPFFPRLRLSWALHFVRADFNSCSSLASAILFASNIFQFVVKHLSTAGHARRSLVLKDINSGISWSRIPRPASANECSAERSLEEYRRNHRRAGAARIRCVHKSESRLCLRLHVWTPARSALTSSHEACGTLTVHP